MKIYNKCAVFNCTNVGKSLNLKFMQTINNINENYRKGYIKKDWHANKQTNKNNLNCLALNKTTKQSQALKASRKLKLNTNL